jgi:YD repeat-containing protein
MKKTLTKITALLLALIFSTVFAIYAATYKYDESGRLVEITTEAGDKVIYIYDEAGNITGISVIAANAKEIHNADQLKDINDSPRTRAGSYRLAADIDLSGEAWVPIGKKNSPFSGMFDGNGFKITGLNVNSSDSYNGLFGASGGTIINLTLENANVTGIDYTGAITGLNSGNIINCYVSGNSVITGNDYVGGITGGNTGGALSSFFTGSVNGNSYVGGFAGEVSAGTIEKCYATGTVNAYGTYAGGFAGYIGSISSGIKNSFSAGKVTGLNSAGFVGYIESGAVSNCYAVSDNENGFSTSTSALNCFYDIDFAPLTAKPEGRTTLEMKTASTYTGWDFADVWVINEGVSYPVLIGMPSPDMTAETEADTLWLTFEIIKGANETENNVRTNLVLPFASQNGAIITWVSDKPEFIDESGKVTRPAFEESAEEVTLTAVLTYAFGYSEISFTFTVLAEEIGDAEKPKITLQPLPVTVLEGADAQLTVEASVLSGVLSYQWYENTPDGDVLIEGADQPAFNPFTDIPGEYFYYCVITNTDELASKSKTNHVVSEIASVLVLSIEDANIISVSELSDITVLTGDTAVLSVEAVITSGVLSYQWYEKTEEGDVPIEGATSAVYEVVTIEDGEKEYFCIVTNTDEAATGNKTFSVATNTARVTAVAATDAEIPVITEYPTNYEVALGQAVVLSVNASVNSGNLSYQWLEDEKPIDGATSMYFIAPTDTEGVKFYACEITNTDESATRTKTASVSTGAVSVSVSAHSLGNNILLDIDGVQNFGSANLGYDSFADAVITITNTGTNDLTGLSAEVVTGDTGSFIITAQPEADLPVGASTVITVKPADGLPEKAHMAIISVSGDTGVITSFIVSFSVNTEQEPVPEPEPETEPEPEPIPEPVPVPVPTPRPSPSFPNPPSPPPAETQPAASAAPKPSDSSEKEVNITVNNRRFAAYEDADGTLNITINNAYESENGVLKISGLRQYDNIIANIYLTVVKNDSLIIETGFGTITIPNETLRAMGKKVGNIIRLELSRGSFSVTLLDGRGRVVTYSDAKNAMELTLPYAPKNGQTFEAAIVTDTDGNIIQTAIPKGNSVEFTITETGKYDVTNGGKTITDIKGHKAEKDIIFTAARGLFDIFTGGRFAPDEDMTRVMFVRALAAIENVNLDETVVSRFADVSAKDAAAVEWAAGKGIISGSSESKFEPESPVTREQMAVMLSNFMKYKGIKVTGTAASTKFNDGQQISAWALDAVRTIQTAGIITSTNGNFEPQEKATRADAALYLRKLIEFAAKQ